MQITVELSLHEVVDLMTAAKHVQSTVGVEDTKHAVSGAEKLFAASAEECLKDEQCRGDARELLSAAGQGVAALNEVFARS